MTALHIEYGASHAELKVCSDGGIKIMEIGARMGGDFIGSHLVASSTGYDYLADTINIALGKFNNSNIPDCHIPISNSERHSGIIFLGKETENIKYAILNSSAYPEIIQSELKKGELKKISTNDDRLGYIIYESDHRIDKF